MIVSVDGFATIVNEHALQPLYDDDALAFAVAVVPAIGGAALPMGIQVCSGGLLLLPDETIAKYVSAAGLRLADGYPVAGVIAVVEALRRAAREVARQQLRRLPPAHVTVPRPAALIADAVAAAVRLPEPYASICAALIADVESEILAGDPSSPQNSPATTELARPHSEFLTSMAFSPLPVPAPQNNWNMYSGHRRRACIPPPVHVAKLA